MNVQTAAPTTMTRRGFSLIEVMISAAILLIGITGLVLGVHLAIGQHAHNRKLALALVIAEKRMESLLLLFPSSGELRDGRHPETGFEFFTEQGRAALLPTDSPIDEVDGFRLFYEVTPSAISEGDDPIIGLRLDITVAWDEPLGERTLDLRTAR